ncbi:valine--tRNA ligase [Sphingomonas sp. CL5.1]|uniref:valine--tRNA ligase n=1 Tax=Sphingomonas sp. CL5.1 TaxID=2653203 RepID=UPI0015825A47|nr:valine--tRNA ligase [Sphingomonas sp. CL5.1]QKS00216.1 valine--tRNA ligase [Sphingomonas sp. CL5.1]
MTELSKTFDPAEIESRWYAHWEGKGLFRPERPGAEPWTIVNPPPNVTGSLHIGHALDNTLQDILTRHARLKGKDALWVVGTDHAGIATQMVVERQMAERQEKRTDFTREEFVAKVWEWKAQSGGAITRQLRRLGCSMDWANERFTMDEGFSKAVLKVFVDLHRQGLIYRDKRLVNWDPGLGTAISDLEVETREVNGKFWHLRYPLADGSGFISVATTRPETMLADMAVAVNPEDERYKALIGKRVKLPITGRLIPIIADEHADPELGSGAVKITPGHDFNDFEVGRRAGIEARDMLNMLDAKAQVTQVADGLIPADLIGIDRFWARKQVVERLEAEGFLERVEDRVIQTPYGDRSGEVIEPWLTDQWYVDAATLAKPAIEAVTSGKTRIVPKTWEKTYFNWMDNIQPWCVSRQLWWGHRIPAWFADDGRIFVAESEADAQAQAGEGVALVQDPDVLDTWFSSALWPFATMGWPEDADPTLHGRYPNDVLISGFDILFFWDARMMMQGLHFMKDVPFRTLYLHGLVRAADGAKMSKSKGNTVDPLGLIDKYGADALRFFMAAMESQGRDIKMDEKRVEGYRNFATKLWNASRFCQANGIGGSATLEPPAANAAVNKWIVGECVKAIQSVDLALAELRFDAAANAIYHFVWSQFCDWYLELIKSQIDDETRAVAGWVLDQVLVVLHPFMPFITEELWHALAPRAHELIVAQWPMVDARAIDPAAAAEVDWLIDFLSTQREVRAEVNVPPGARPALYVLGHQTVAGSADPATFPDALIHRFDRYRATINRMGRVDVVTFLNTGMRFDLKSGERESRVGETPLLGSGVQFVVGDDTYFIALEGTIDLDAERARLAKSIAGAEKERDALAARLGNASFVERAKPEAVEKARADHADKAAEAERLAAALARLG